MRPLNFMIVYAETMIEPTTLKRTRFASRKCAQNAADRLSMKRGGVKYAVYSLEEYAKAIKGKGEWKKSPFTGKLVWVALGTPACCDPTTETYMSM